MDAAFNQHSPYSRHHARSSSTLNHLTLAPLTSRLPLSDFPESTQHISYIEGRSAPTTPSILSRNPSRLSLRKPGNSTLPKSKSSTYLLASGKQQRPYGTPPGGTKLRKGVSRDDSNLTILSANDRNDSDWLLRAGAALSLSARESKGQAWLVSRASSTSLTGQLDEDEEALERELSREREHASRIVSRRGSAAAAFDADDECSPVTTRRSFSFGPTTGTGSRPISRFESRGSSRRGSRAQLFTPVAGERDGYFDQKDFAPGEFVTEPDFVNFEEEGYDNEDELQDDDAVVRKLARASSLGLGGWVERMLGWSLFAVDEDVEETEGDTLDERAEDSEMSSKPSRGNIDGVLSIPAEERMPTLDPEETGGWHDAAWLLTVATKVLL